MQPRPAATDSSSCSAIAVADGVEFLIESLGQMASTLVQLARADGDYDRVLLSGTGVETALLSSVVSRACGDTRSLHQEVILSPPSGLVSKEATADQTQQCYDEFLSRYLNNFREKLITNLMRLDQIAEVYCKDSDDALASQFYRDAEGFRQEVSTLRQRLRFLGIELTPIRFFEPAIGGEWKFTEHSGKPLFYSGEYLRIVAKKKGISLGRDLTSTVVDVSLWGYKCEDQPDYSRDSNGWVLYSW